MLVLIDESGCTGFKESSSRYFVMTLIVFNDNNGTGRYPSAEYTASVVEKISNELGYRSEFHFSQCSHKARHAFFNGLNEHNCDFSIYALVVDKSKIYSPQLRSNTKSFYNFILKQLLAKNPITNAKVKIDGTKSKIFQKELKTYLRRGQEDMIAKLKFADSRSDFLVQLADMCCSAIAYKFSRSDKLYSDNYLKLLGSRVKDVWEFK